MSVLKSNNNGNNQKSLLANNNGNGFDPLKVRLMLREARNFAGLSPEEFSRKMRKEIEEIQKIELHDEHIRAITLARLDASITKRLK